MKRIGGNITATIQTKTGTKNSIGENVPSWSDSFTVLGWLDLSSGDSKYTNFSAKIQESTHVFLCDYVSELNSVTAENARMIINDLVYEILLIDNPMGMCEHHEVYLRFIGGQNGDNI